MDLKYLHTFRTVVEEGSFSKAAERLNYTQSTITFHIGRLERELSASLFEKIGRRMVLTKAGEQLLPYVNEVLHSVERLRCFGDDLAECRGDVRIGVGETLLCYHLPAVLKEFQRRAPEARLFLRSMNCYDIRDELISGALDLGVFYKDVGGFGANLAAAPFGTYPLALVASPETKRRYPDFISPGQRLPVPFIINEPNCVFRQIFEKYLRAKSILLDHTIELWSIPTIKNLVQSDVGVSFLPRFAVREELAAGKLVEIATEIADPAITAVCGHHKNKWLSPLMRLFIELCGGTARGGSLR
ncbi:MAG: LysR family transcriptional regulator [Clostridiales Family XIII bacterium]|jgi:DNA-binding transcriptional LysR family regulator|nr:LysR family transcriptional regulator [Clostridiales Family XIII bacterium]